MSETVRVTLIKSMISRPEKHRKILRALGLTRIRRSRLYPKTPDVMGQVQKVCHLVRVEENP